MIKGALTVAALLSVIALPWQFAAFFVLAAGTVVPLLPLACGLFLEALYWTPGAYPVPIFALLGAVATFGLYLVRGRVKASIIE